MLAPDVRFPVLSMAIDGSTVPNSAQHNHGLFENLPDAVSRDWVIHHLRQVGRFPCAAPKAARRLELGQTTRRTRQDRQRRSSRARWQKAQIFHVGALRQVRCKELTKVCWLGGSRKRQRRLRVVAPVGYCTSKNGRQYHRQPVYLLTTDLAQQPVQFPTADAPATAQVMVGTAAA